jgi:hypothetical protein
VRFKVGLLLLAFVFALQAGPVVSAAKKKNKEKSETSKSFSFATYKQRDDRTIVLVGTLTAAIFEREAFVPIQIAVGVRGHGPKLMVRNESFELIDRDGNRYPMPSYEEVLTAGNLLERVELARNQNPLVIGQQFANSLPVAASFFPAPGTNIVLPFVELPRETYFQALIYFPQPAGGLEDVLTLRFQADGLPEPIDVRVKVPLKR